MQQVAVSSPQARFKYWDLDIAANILFLLISYLLLERFYEFSMFGGVFLCVLAVNAVAQCCARHSLLEAFAVLLLAMRLLTIASFEMALAVVALFASSQSRGACHVCATQSGHRIRHLQVPSLWRGLCDDLRLSEGLGVTHEDVLLCTDSDLVKLRLVVATSTCAGGPTISVVGKALAIQFQTLWLSAVARLVGSRTCVVGRKAWVESSSCLWH